MASPCWDCVEASVQKRNAEARARELIARIPKDYRSCITEEQFRERHIPLKKRVTAGTLLTKPKVVIGGARSGCGKSTIAAWMLRGWLMENPGRVGLWLSAHDLVGDDFDIDLDWLHADLVVLDDIGAERQVTTSLLPKFLEKRTAGGDKLWMTTALTPDAAANRYGEHIARRIFDRAILLDMTS